MFRRVGGSPPEPSPALRATLPAPAAAAGGSSSATAATDAGAPNIVIILIDDVGYGQFGTFGGQTPTPGLDRLAAEGLRYTRFHTTALCSPTRAALLTGRNHHSAATGVITEAATGYDGYTGMIPRSAGTVAEVLRQYGYATSWFGKNHNTPD